jgi:hypothetical protein
MEKEEVQCHYNAWVIKYLLTKWVEAAMKYYAVHLKRPTAIKNGWWMREMMVLIIKGLFEYLRNPNYLDQPEEGG